MGSFISKIQEYIQEEASDGEKYRSLARNAPEKYAPILRDIAKEEDSHKRHLEEILADCGVCASEVEEPAEEDPSGISETTEADVPDVATESAAMPGKRRGSDSAEA